jgi:hypothetical protein
VDIEAEQRIDRSRYRLLRMRPRGGLHDGTCDERGVLAEFYVRLDAAARRRRFHGGVSDGAIRQRCFEIDPAWSLAVGRWIGAELSAVLELHAHPAGWHDAEVALCCDGGSELHDVRVHLVQIGIFAAVARGCRSLHCYGEDEAVPILLGLDGQLAGESIVVDISGYGPQAG